MTLGATLGLLDEKMCREIERVTKQGTKGIVAIKTPSSLKTWLHKKKRKKQSVIITPFQ